MSQENSEYTQLLHDIATAVGVQTKEAHGFDGLRARDEVKPNARLRDEVMQRIGVLLDCEGRVKEKGRIQHHYEGGLMGPRFASAGSDQ